MQNSFSQSFVYKDISFHASSEITSSKKDAPSLFDTEAIKNSVRTLLTTNKGEKLLDPAYGVDIKAFLFESITELHARMIGREIQDAIKKYEPRVNVEKIDFYLYPEDQLFHVILYLKYPHLPDSFQVDLKLSLHQIEPIS